MTYDTDSRRRAALDRENALLDLIRDCGRLAPAVLAKQEMLATHMAASEIRRQLGPPAPGPARSWIAAQLVALGTRLAGRRSGLEPATVAAEDPAAAHAHP